VLQFRSSPSGARRVTAAAAGSAARYVSSPRPCSTSAGAARPHVDVEALQALYTGDEHHFPPVRLPTGSRDSPLAWWRCDEVRGRLLEQPRALRGRPAPATGPRGGSTHAGERASRPMNRQAHQRMRAALRRGGAHRHAGTKRAICQAARAPLAAEVSVMAIASARELFEQRFARSQRACLRAYASFERAESVHVGRQRRRHPPNRPGAGSSRAPHQRAPFRPLVPSPHGVHRFRACRPVYCASGACGAPESPRHLLHEEISR